MKPRNILITGLMILTVASAHGAEAVRPDVAQEILQDERMDKVLQMGHALLKTGVNSCPCWSAY